MEISRTAREIAEANGLSDAVERLDHLNEMIDLDRKGLLTCSNDIVRELLALDLARFIAQRADFERMILDSTYPC